MSLLPYLNEEGIIVDGTFFHLLPFCKAKFAKGKCKMYYENLANGKTGAYCCPHGLSSFIYEMPTGKVIYTGIRIKEKYAKKKAKTISAKQNTYNPVIDESSCLSIVKEMSFSLLEKQEAESQLDAIRDLLHETRSLNGQIKNSIDSLWEMNLDEESIDRTVMLETLKSVHVSSFMISNRFSYFDAILNPSLSIGEPYTANIFKKFDKMRKLLKGYMRKNVWISVYSPIQSEYRFKIYPTFETLLFIILENAIKYSPSGNAVTVRFEENANVLDVQVVSVGPYCDDNEIVHLCEKGFRGENAVLTKNVGQGFGLNFAKQICLDHNIGIEFNSVYAYKDHGVKYGNFYVMLHFDNSKNSEAL